MSSHRSRFWLWFWVAVAVVVNLSQSVRIAVLKREVAMVSSRTPYPSVPDCVLREGRCFASYHLESTR